MKKFHVWKIKDWIASTQFKVQKRFYGKIDAVKRKSDEKIFVQGRVYRVSHNLELVLHSFDEDLVHVTIKPVRLKEDNSISDSDDDEDKVVRIYEPPFVCEINQLVFNSNDCLKFNNSWGEIGGEVTSMME